jgi:RimJ/RimL family protein N-acetyltransferase
MERDMVATLQRGGDMGSVSTAAGNVVRRKELRDGRVCEIRLVAPEEAQAFVEFMQQLFAESNHFFSRDQADMTVAQAHDFLEAENRKGRVLGAYVDGQLMGNIDISRQTPARRNHVASFSMGLLNALQRQGIGRALVEEAIAWAKRKGNIEKVTLYVRSHNAPALALYQKLGFIEEGRRVKEWRVGGEYVDEVLMYKWLKDES